jgi:hypothetical protein
MIQFYVIYIYIAPRFTCMLYSYYFYTFILFLQHQLTDFFFFFLKKSYFFLFVGLQPIFWHRSRTLFVSDISGRKMWEVVRDSIQTVTPHVSITRLITQIHTHTYTHARSLSLSLILSLSLTHTHTHTHTNTHKHTHSIQTVTRLISMSSCQAIRLV